MAQKRDQTRVCVVGGKGVCARALAQILNKFFKRWAKAKRGSLWGRNFVRL